MKTIFVCVALVSIFWGSWPLVARAAGLTGATGTFLLGIASLIPTTLFMLRSGADIPSTASLLNLAAAGIMMGAGLILFNILATNPHIEISTIVPIINVLMLFVTTIGGIWFFSESITVSKVAGIVLIAVAIFLLRPS